MAKRPSTRPAAGDQPAAAPASAAAPAAEVTPSPDAGAASAAPEAGDAPEATPADRSVSELDLSQPPGGDAGDTSPPAPPNDTAAAEHAAPATEPAVAGDAGGDALAVQLASIGESVDALIEDVRGLVALAEFCPAGSNQAALDGVLDQLARLVSVTNLVGSLEAALQAETSELEELSVRSRDGKPFRRAGLLLGDDYQSFSVTAEQAETIRADRRGCQIKGEN